MIEPRRLVIYQTSDVHARRGFGRKVAALAEPDSLIVDCGDALRGSSTMYFGREPVAAEFAAAPYAAVAVGNREFHYVHKWFASRAAMLPVPLVCSNLLDLRGRTPPFVRELRVTRNGVRARLLGVLVPQYRTGSGWEKIFGWRFLAPEVALAEMLAQTGDEVTIVLSHLGLDADRRLAAAFPMIGAVLGGHTHAALPEPEVVNGVPIAHVGAFARHVGRLELDVGENGAGAQLRSFRLLPLLEGSDAER